jgi:hypothetical protein
MIVAVSIGSIGKAVEEVVILGSLGLVSDCIVFSSFQIMEHSLQHAYVLHARVCHIGCQLANCIANI